MRIISNGVWMMNLKLLLKCMVASALGLLIALGIGFSVAAVIFDLTLADILNGVVKLSIGLAIAYVIMIPLVYLEQIKKQ